MYVWVEINIIVRTHHAMGVIKKKLLIQTIIIDVKEENAEQIV